MSSNGWSKWKLAQLVDDIAMGPFGSNIKVDNFIDKGVPVIRGSNLNEGGFNDEKFVFISEEKAASLKRSLAYPDDLVFTHRGTIGQVGIIPSGKHPKYLVSQSQMRLTVNKEYLNPKYLYYFFKSPNGQYELLKNASQVGVPAIASPTTSLKEIDISIPPLPTQRRIAAMLSALDDKIELNRQTNATLEAMAQAIFKEWFVDFRFPLSVPRLEGLADYRDYAATLQSGQSRHQANHGTEMVESELGLIPRGWRVGSILETADLLSGGTPSTQIAGYWNGQIKWVSAKDVGNAQGTFVLDTERKISQTGIDNSSTKVLPTLTTVVTARGTVGSYCILAEPMAMNQTNYGLKGKTDRIDYFVFFSLSNLVAHLLQAAYGTIFDTVTTKTFEQSKIVIPPNSLIQQFDQQVLPIMDRLLCDLQQSATLAQVRDSLLPKLMSGEIEV